MMDTLPYFNISLDLMLRVPVNSCQMQLPHFATTDLLSAHCHGIMKEQNGCNSQMSNFVKPFDL